MIATRIGQSSGLSRAGCVIRPNRNHGTRARSRGNHGTLMSIRVVLRRGCSAGALVAIHTAASGQALPPRVPFPEAALVTPIGQSPSSGIVVQSFDVGLPVKGAPYSASAATEIVQVLIDGNRIVRTTQGAVYRDSLGRTRREQAVAAVGSPGLADLPATIAI